MTLSSFLRARSKTKAAAPGCAASASSSTKAAGRETSMLITRSQMQAMQEATLDMFVRRVTTFIEAKCDFSHPHDGSAVPVDRVERVALVKSLIMRARTYGIETELGLSLFVIVGLGYSREFDQLPAARKMLLDRAYPPDENIQRVANAVVVAEMRSL